QGQAVAAAQFGQRLHVAAAAAAEAEVLALHHRPHVELAAQHAPEELLRRQLQEVVRGAQQDDLVGAVRGEQAHPFGDARQGGGGGRRAGRGAGGGGRTSGRGRGRGPRGPGGATLPAG